MYGFKYFSLIQIIFKKICLTIDVTLTGTSTPDQRGTGNNGNSRVTPHFTDM